MDHDPDAPPHVQIYRLSERVAVMEERAASASRKSHDHETRIRTVEQFGPKLFAWATAGGFVASFLARILDL